MNRREFLSLAVAAPAVAPAVIEGLATAGPLSLSRVALLRSGKTMTTTWLTVAEVAKIYPMRARWRESI